MAVTDLLKSRIQTKAASFPVGAYREQLERKQNEGDSFVRDPKAEQVIIQKWEVAFLYSKYVIKGEWPAFETAMLDAPYTKNVVSQKAAYNYAADVKKGPVDGVAKQVSLNGELSADYAINVARQAWDPKNPDHVRALNSIDAHPQASEKYVDGLYELADMRLRRYA